MTYPLHRTAVLAALLAAGCGRSELRVDPRVVDGGVAADAMPDAMPDAPQDFPDVVAPSACTDLQIVAGPTIVLGERSGSFATPRVVARRDGFDVFAPQRDTMPLGIRGRTLTVRGAPAEIVRGDVTILGENSFTWAEGGSDGAVLGLGYNASGRIFRAWAGAYESRAQTPLMIREQVGTSAGVVWNRDRWVMAWTGTGAGSGSAIVEVGADGRQLGPSRSARVNLTLSTPAITAYGDGVAWVGAGEPDTFSVVFWPRGGEPNVTRVNVGSAGANVRITAWPPDPSAVALTWREADGDVRLVVVNAAGARLVDRVAIRGIGTARGVEMTPFRDGVAIAEMSCGERMTDDGAIAVHRFGADGEERGGGASTPLNCRSSVLLASIAANGGDIALVWTTLRDTPLGDTTLAAVALRCVD